MTLLAPLYSTHVGLRGEKPYAIAENQGSPDSYRPRSARQCRYAPLREIVGGRVGEFVDTESGQTPILLRAEVVHDGEPVVAHTLEMSKSMVFVKTHHQAYIGDSVVLHLSFPGLLERTTFETQVISHRLPSGPGQPGGLVLGFVFHDDTEKQRLGVLLDRLGVTQNIQNIAPKPDDRTLFRILLVEDSLIASQAFEYCVAKFFSERGAERVVVDVADNVAQARGLAEGGPYDLVIVDFFLGAETGDVFIAELRARAAAGQLPIVAISAADAEARERSLAAGADFFMEKPLAHRDLFSTLERLLAWRKTA
jgi:CheY-like chemotaxis protein